ncbi:hypothetical protein [Deinococcus sp.]|uniref:hypothetical protein n=1 Tax=Deinococcus sp. TaxID=47478 RepID=UPI003C7B607F
MSRPYRDAAHLQSLLAAVFAYPYSGEEARLLTRSGLSVGFSFLDPALEVLLDGRPGAATADQPAVLFGAAARQAPAADLRFSMNGEVAHRFWTGDLNMVKAMTLGQLRLEGSPIRALSIAGMMPAMQEVYRATREAQG